MRRSLACDVAGLSFGFSFGFCRLKSSDFFFESGYGYLLNNLFTVCKYLASLVEKRLIKEALL
jgi:hypothetical protein